VTEKPKLIWRSRAVNWTELQALCKDTTHIASIRRRFAQQSRKLNDGASHLGAYQCMKERRAV
jgi:hypothetical protein